MRSKIIQIVLLFAILVINYVDSGIYCCSGEMSFLNYDTFACTDENNITTAANLTCTQSETPVAVFVSDMNISKVGELVAKFHGQKIQLAPGTFCDTREESNTSSPERLLLTCAEEPKSDESTLGYCMLVSVIFLTLTALVYSILPEMRDVSGKSIINFCVSLASGLFILFVMKVFEYSDMRLCALRGFLVYFFMVATFFWSNAIAIQMLLSTRRPLVPDYGWKQFLWYALYAWGCPTLLTAGMAVVNFHPGDHQKPGIGLNDCWFYDVSQQWLYMYSVMSVLLAVNICIFVYITLHLKKLSFSSSHPKQVSLKYKSIMMIRLIVVMGLPWIFEMIGSLLKKHFIWDILDLFNVLQGLLIFLLLVVFRRRVVKALHRRGCLNCVSGYVERHLAVGDDEEDIVQDTTDIPLNQ